MPQAQAPRRRGVARNRPPRPGHPRARPHRPGPGRQAAPQGQAAPPHRGPGGEARQDPGGGDAHIREARRGLLPLAPGRLGGRHRGGPRGWRLPRHARGPQERLPGGRQGRLPHEGRRDLRAGRGPRRAAVRGDNRGPRQGVRRPRRGRRGPRGARVLRAAPPPLAAGGATRTPTAWCASTSPRAPTSRASETTRSPRCTMPSTAGRASDSGSGRPWRSAAQRYCTCSDNSSIKKEPPE